MQELYIVLPINTSGYKIQYLFTANCIIIFNSESNLTAYSDERNLTMAKKTNGKKRENGAGTWKERTDGLFELRLSFGRDFNGKLIRKSFYGKTKKICRDKSKKYSEQLQQKEIIHQEITLGNWIKQWLVTYKMNKVSEGTYQNYLYNRDIILKHDLSKMKLLDIKPIHISIFFNDNHEYSASVLKKLKLILNGSFEAAIDNELCYQNPVRKIKLTYKKKKERDYFTSEELNIIYNFASIDTFGYIIETLLQTGIRSGELRALKWSDIDLNNKLLYINKSIKANGKIGTTKSNNCRTIPIPEKLYTTLKNITPVNNYFTKTENYLSKHGFRSKYDTFFAHLKNEYPNVRFLSPHCCRHTYASTLLTKNVPLKYIQILLGHNDIQTTGNIYTHTDINEIINMIDKL